MNFCKEPGGSPVPTWTARGILAWLFEFCLCLLPALSFLFSWMISLLHSDSMFLWAYILTCASVCVKGVIKDFCSHIMSTFWSERLADTKTEILLLSPPIPSLMHILALPIGNNIAVTYSVSQSKCRKWICKISVRLYQALIDYGLTQ